jgi:hypothetical protein
MSSEKPKGIPLSDLMPGWDSAEDIEAQTPGGYISSDEVSRLYQELVEQGGLAKAYPKAVVEAKKKAVTQLIDEFRENRILLEESEQRVHQLQDKFKPTLTKDQILNIQVILSNVADKVTIFTKLPCPFPRESGNTEPLTLVFNAGYDTGIDYVKKTFGMVPEVLNLRPEKK